MKLPTPFLHYDQTMYVCIKGQTTFVWRKRIRRNNKAFLPILTKHQKKIFCLSSSKCLITCDVLPPIMVLLTIFLVEEGKAREPKWSSFPNIFPNYAYYKMPTIYSQMTTTDAHLQIPTIMPTSYWRMVVLFWCHTGVAAKTLFPNMAVLRNLCHQNLITAYLQNAD